MIDRTFKKCTIRDLSMDDEFENCTFSDCDLASADLGGLTFIDCRFEHCDLANATLLDTALRNITFESCKMMGLFFEQCKPFGLEIRFEDCTLDFSSFHAVQLPGTAFERCRLIDADLAEADLSDCVFTECDLRGALFDHTNCENTDFSTAVNLTLDPDENRIRGAKFSLFGLPGLLSKYEIEIQS